jgi:hypothetical protein
MTQLLNRCRREMVGKSKVSQSIHEHTSGSLHPNMSSVGSIRSRTGRVKQANAKGELRRRLVGCHSSFLLLVDHLSPEVTYPVGKDTFREVEVLLLQAPAADLAIDRWRWAGCGAGAGAWGGNGCSPHTIISHDSTKARARGSGKHISGGMRGKV